MNASFASTTVTFGGSFEDKVRAMSAAGFRATEVWVRDLYEHLEGPEVALRVLRDNGVRIAALQAIRNFEGCDTGQRARKLDLARHVMDLAVLASAPIVTLAANVDPLADGATARLVEDLGVLAQEARERGLRVAFEPIAWASHVRGFTHALELVTAVDDAAIGVQLDVFHEFVRGEQSVALTREAAASVFLVEICDLPRCALPAQDVSRDLRLFPGEGTAPLQPVAQTLRAAGYRGDVVVEVFNASYRQQPPGLVAERAWRSLNEWANAAAEL